MAVRLTKTSKIIFAVAITLLSVSLGFLIWRINQTDQLDPGDSDAGGTGTGCSEATIKTCKQGCRGNYFLNCYEKNDEGEYEVCGDIACGEAKRCKCCDGTWVKTNSGSCSDACKSAGKKDQSGGNCGDTKTVKCSCKSWSNGCGVDCTFPSGTQESVKKKAAGTCSAWIAMCNVSDGSVTISEYKSGHPCYGKDSSGKLLRDICKNPYAEEDCTPTNVCDGGSWVTKPTGNIEYDSNITFSAKAKDSDGIKKDSIVVKKGDTTLPVCSGSASINCITLSESSTETTISGTLSNSSSRLSPGEYTISMSWKDSKDVTSSACALSTTFTVLAKQTNPNWEINKSVVEQCIDEGTDNPKAQLTYTVTVKNTGDGAGTISKIEDVLDSKVEDDFVQTSTITSPGAYSDGKIVWNYTSTPLSFTAGQSRTYTYKLLLDKESFDTYANTVTLTPVGSGSIVAAANITADCEIVEPEPEPEPEPEADEEVPQTGIFDSTVSRIAVGFSLIVLGGLIYNIPNGVFKKREQSYKYRDRFEKKVANR